LEAIDEGQRIKENTEDRRQEIGDRSQKTEDRRSASLEGGGWRR